MLPVLAATAVALLAPTATGAAGHTRRTCARNVKVIVGQTELFGFRIATSALRCDPARYVIRAYLVEKVRRPYSCAQRSQTSGCQARGFVCHETFKRRHGGALNYCTRGEHRLTFFERGRRV